MRTAISGANITRWRKSARRCTGDLRQAKVEQRELKPNEAKFVKFADAMESAGAGRDFLTVLGRVEAESYGSRLATLTRYNACSISAMARLTCAQAN